MSPKFSIIVPSFNEGESLPILIKDLVEVFQKSGKPFEILCIDDGSTDNTLAVLVDLCKEYKPVLRAFHLRKNLGKSIVYNIGFYYARGDICVTIDADLQDAPSEVFKLIKKLDEGYDAVVGWRKIRKDSWSKKIASLLWNKVVSLLIRANFHDLNSGLKVLRRDVLISLYLYGDFHRYLPVLLYWEGYKVAEVPVIHRERQFGKSKYSFLRMFSGLFDLVTALFLRRFGRRPMHFFGGVGILLFLAGMCINIYLGLIKLQGLAIGGRPLLILGVLLTISGIQLVMAGFLADLIIRQDKVGPDITLIKKSLKIIA